VFQIGLFIEEQVLVTYSVSVVVPTVLQDSTISMNTMTSTPIMKTSGAVGVTYGAGQKVVVLTMVSVVVAVEIE
jgi:hypothetical protein